MPRIKKTLYAVIIAFLLSTIGCGSATRQYLPKPTSPVVSMDAVRIIVERTTEFGGSACDLEIKDGDTPVGWIFMVGTDADRKAIEHTSWTNGALTHCLIKGLSGEADGFESL